MIEARALSVSYSGREVLEGVDLQARASELVAVIGPNGAGKTTLVRAFAGTIRPSRGEVLLDGRPLEERSRAEIAREIAVVPQDVPSAPGFSVRDVVAMGRAPHQGRWLRRSPDDEARIDAALERCDVAALAERPLSALSGGERKRVLLAQALVQSPRVLLLDEPSAFLDLKHALATFELVREEVARGVAVLAVLHDLALAARYADRVALVANGRVLARGTPDDVLRDEVLERAFGVRVVRLRDEATGVDAFAPARAPR